MRSNMYVLQVLRSHGLNDAALKDIYRSVAMAKLLYASSAWWGFATASDKHRIEDFVRRGVRLQLYGAADPTPTQLAEDADETLFSRIIRNRHHVLYRFLPKPNSHQHNLRPRRHNFSLSTKTDDRNFIIRQLFLDSYWCVVDLTIVISTYFSSDCTQLRSVQLFIKAFYYYYYYKIQFGLVQVNGNMLDWLSDWLHGLPDHFRLYFAQRLDLFT